MSQNFIETLLKEHQNCYECPSNESIHEFFEEVMGILFPIYAKRRLNNESQLRTAMEVSKIKLTSIIPNKDKVYIQKLGLAQQFFAKLPQIYELLCKDIDAMFDGDPAAKSKDEVMRTYPGFYAIAAYRIANEMEKLEMDILPRSITETAHNLTGIDIHPGATIDEYFCIDHGTGVVIGETSVIGKHVKIYQGVTLGALSVNKADADKKRHPTIEDNVVVYAGATILGGNTIVGKGSIIGGNVWLTRSVPAKSKVYYRSQMHHEATGDGQDTTDMIVFT